jgi:hypothetical protein
MALGMIRMKKWWLLLLMATCCFAQLKYDRAIEWSLPDTVQKRFATAHFLDTYDLSDRINPFYLRGDFDGDGQPDYAVLVTNKNSKKSEIAICLSTRKVIDVLGVDGTKLRVGTKEDGYDLADFDWMDAWQVQPRLKLTPNELNSDTTIAQMAGEGLMVEKTEAASALVYWDGKEFRWYQMSD